jgi:diaminopimelate epimerase
VAGVACARGLCAYDAPVTVRLPGGDLVVIIAQATTEATMRGPARRAFVGEVAVP